jgi:hypothetical protein
MNSLYEKSRTYQQELIYSFLDTYFLELDEEHIDIESTIEENIFNNALKIVNDLKQSFKKSAGDNYTGYNTEEKLLLDVIIKNHDNCNRLCTGGKVIPNSVLMSLLYIQTNRPGESQKTADILSKVYNSSDINKFKSDIDFNAVSRCLRMCYLDYLTSIYAEGILNYEICREKLSGVHIKITSLADILTNYPIDDLCDDIYITMTSLYENISKILNYVYLNDSLKKKKWVEVIFNKLNALRRGQTYNIDFTKIDDQFEYPTDYVQIGTPSRMR